MRITFLGATHEVTGSCYYLEACGKKFLVDCGMEQGPNVFENKPIPVPPSSLDFVLVTHAHIDHTGRLPALYAKGFRGNVFATNATADLCDIMLRDSAHIQMFEAAWRTKKNRRMGKPDEIPPYTMEDAMGIIKNIVGKSYGEMITLADGIQIRFVDAGHLLGSASIEVFLTEKGETKKIVFSGDIGNINQPLIHNPSYIEEADYVVMESTYGDRSHGPVPDYISTLVDIIQKTFDRGGNVVIPSFAVGRTQEILYFIRQIKQEKRIHGHDGFTVYVDSPLAVEATHIFQEHYAECFDDEAAALVHSGVNPIQFPGLKLSITSEDSKAINFEKTPKVIISASGMCDAGRVKHHLKHNLWREESTILFVGYQSVGTPGRAIVDGAESIKIFGESIHVKAEIRVLNGISGHADDAGLMRWAAAYKTHPKKVFVTHGEDKVTEIFAARLKDEFELDAMAPYSGTVYDLLEDKVIEAPEPVRLEKVKTVNVRKNSIFERLLAAGERLIAVIRKNEGGANKDLSRFADQINSLCDKWDR